jgi:hypothetical protein
MISRDLDITRVESVTLLEEPVEELHVKSASFDGEKLHEVKLDFRGFEVKTVRVCLEKKKERRESAGSWVKV